MTTSMRDSCCLAILFFVFFAKATYTHGAGCQIPTDFQGEWFSIDHQDGRSVITTIDGNGWKQSTKNSRLRCQQIHKNDVTGTTLLMKSEDKSDTCIYCIRVIQPVSNILQLNIGSCMKNAQGDIAQVCNTKSHVSPDTASTFFRTIPKVVNCKSTLDGLYQFSYEYDIGGGGICDNPGSKIEACQDPGSPYVNNEVFLMTYKKCADVSSSEDKKVRYRCLGSWSAEKSGITYKFAAVADTVSKDNREKYKCMTTLENQRIEDQKSRWVMSRFADCRNLNSIYSAPVRLVLAPLAPTSPVTQAKCKLPVNLRGKWSVDMVEYSAKVLITEDKMIIRPDVVNMEIAYSCQSKGTIYVMTKTIKGKCDTELVCIQLTPEKDGTMTFLEGMPTEVNEYTYPDFKKNDFQTVCSNSFISSEIYKLNSV